MLGGEQVPVQVRENDFVYEVRQRVGEARDVPTTQVVLILKGQALQDFERVSGDGTTVISVTILPPGCRAPGCSTEGYHPLPVPGTPELVDLVEAGDATRVQELLCSLRTRHTEEMVLKEIMSCDHGERNAKSALHTAARRGHAAVLQVLLAARADANAADDTGNTPLHLAAGGGRDAAVDLLLQLRADAEVKNNFGRRASELAPPKSWDAAPVQEAKRRVSILLGINDIPDCTATQSGGSVASSKVVAATVTTTQTTTQARQVPATLLDVLSTPTKETFSGELSPTAESISEGKGPIRTKANALPPAPGARLQPSLAKLADCGDLDGTKKRMAELRAKGGEKTILEEATSCEEDRRNAKSALHVAAARGHTEILTMLLAVRASLDSVTDVGNTPLHVAADSGHGKIITVLLEAKADPHVCNNFGRKPVDLTESRNWDTPKVAAQREQARQKLLQC